MYDQHYTHEVMGTEHIKDLGREMERERRVALLPHRVSLWRRGVGRAGRLLVVLGLRLEGAAQLDGRIAVNG